MKIALIDTDKSVIQHTKKMLVHLGIDIQMPAGSENIHEWALENHPDAMLVSLELEPVDGISLCKEFRDHPTTSGMIFILGSDSDDNYIRALSLNSGADAFLKKPYDAGLLKATLQAVNRRIKIETKPEITSGEPVISIERHLVMFNGNEIMLPRKEFEIFALLYFNRGNVLTRDTIIHKVWRGKKNSVNPRTIDVHIRKLREQIGEKFIHTIKGVGYKYKPT